MFHDKDSQHVVHSVSQFSRDPPLMITKTLFIRLFSSNYGLSWDSFQRNVMHFIISLTNNSLSKSIVNRTNYQLSAYLI